MARRGVTLLPPAKREETVVVSKKTFQAYHSAARTVLAQMMKVTDPRVQLTLAPSMALLDEAIDEGHRVLGTDRGAADKYIAVTGQVTAAQVTNIQKFLEREGYQFNEAGETEPS